ncbi:polyketide cyclase/dehydrase/lipid transport protein [Actinocorallia herbida]|uniref:Polyketide cyclase/dehydrase/lipid transport protein n=1 Tax=Actinocorallia herbida TaxID=58109 RepID=A0A3N1CY27_9ACTN|nr:SRPBCC family protein [Actinocorallia herbida]ROO86200.1 polyketide cyclase/dehydrase/lipid transport protein [Actinocorallia herbida]
MTVLLRAIETSAPTEAVARYLTDFTTAEAWDPGTVSCRRLDEGPVRVGSRFENVSRFRGRETTLVYRLTELVPGVRVTFIGDNKTVTTIDDLHFEPLSTGCRVRYQVDFRFKGLARLAVPFLRPSLEHLADAGAARMKTVLDALPT